MTENVEKEATSEDTNAAKDHGVLYIGMDLGTSRTAISASNGVRESMHSVVGYPKDHIARRVLGKEVLLGQEAVDKRLSLKFIKPLEKGVLKEDDPDAQRAAADLIGAAIAMAKPRKDELIYCVIGVPAQASVHSKEAIIQAARESVDSVMLCSEPFAVAYGLDMLDDALVIDIGGGTADLCRLRGTMPEESDQLTLDVAGDSVDAELSRLMKEACPGADFSLQMVKNFKERYSFLGDPPEPVVIDLPVDGKPTAFDITSQTKQACSLLVQPIVDGLQQLIASFDPEFQHKLRQRVLIAGGGSMIRGLDTAIEQAMARDLGGGKVIRIEEPIHGGSNGALKIAHDMPEEFWEDLR
ncbi:MAG: rod shape-determining protein [Planctomycetota bacterium]|nr:rod shape-determining protein [Planctomycetota bacterium]